MHAHNYMLPAGAGTEEMQEFRNQQKMVRRQDQQAALLLCSPGGLLGKVPGGPSIFLDLA